MKKLIKLQSKTTARDKRHMKHRILRYMTSLVLATGFFIIIGCDGGRVTVGTAPHYETPGPGPAVHGGPPPWAPAHGYRAKYQYRYYPSPQIYYDTGRSIYFYYRDGQWEVSAQIPASLQVQLGDSVFLEMDTGQPYRYHGDVIKRYPPGHPGDKGKGPPKGR